MSTTRYDPDKKNRSGLNERPFVDSHESNAIQMTLQPIPLASPRLNLCLRRKREPSESENYIPKGRVTFTAEGNIFRLYANSDGEIEETREAKIEVSGHSAHSFAKRRGESCHWKLMHLETG